MSEEHVTQTAVTLWLDPVCPFTWNTARWLRAAADAGGVDIDWRLLSLAVLNENRDVPEHLQQRMRDSRRVGRLMAAIRRALDAAAFADAYFAFGTWYFEQGVAVDEDLAGKVLAAVGAVRITPAVLDDSSLDELVAQSHQAGQDAYGGTAGSPMLTVGGRTFFGPVFTDLPEPRAAAETFAALATLAGMEQFTQLERPRVH
jgi:2-hydroxychromene-2-carboxylate isomerase